MLRALATSSGVRSTGLESSSFQCLQFLMLGVFESHAPFQRGHPGLQFSNPALESAHAFSPFIGYPKTGSPQYYTT